MGILIWLVFGATAGWIASLITSTNENQGTVGNIVVGIVGAVIGGLVVQGLGGEGITGFNLPSLLVAIAGAIVLILAFNRITGAKT